MDQAEFTGIAHQAEILSLIFHLGELGRALTVWLAGWLIGFLSLIICSTTLESQEDTPFSTTVKNKCVWGTLASLKSSMIALVWKPDLTVGTTLTVLRSPNAKGIVGSRAVGAMRQH